MVSEKLFRYYLSWRRKASLESYIWAQLRLCYKQKKNIPGRGNSKYKGPEAGTNLECSKEHGK